MATATGKIGLREIRAIRANSELFDGAGGLPGFGARRRGGPVISYFVMFRTAEGRQRRFTIGTHGAPWTPDLARAKAKALLAEVAKGEDPSARKREVREAPTVAELCTSYLEAAETGRLPTRRGGTKKASTIATDRSRIDSHILPLLGSMKVRAVTLRDLDEFMQDVAAGKTHRREHLGRSRAYRNVCGGMGTASRTMGLLGAIFTYAMRMGLRDDNPAQGVLRPADGKRERRLTADEYKALGDGLSKAAAVIPATEEGKPDKAGMWPSAIAAVRFLALTGWRSGEAIGLTWREVDLSRRTAHLGDTKTGASTRPLPHAACAVLAVQKALVGDKADGLVFPPSRGDGTMSGFAGFMARIVKLAELPTDITAHVLRHSFASVAADLELSEVTIASLIGHKGGGITRRYIHSADAVLLAAADKVASEVQRQMGEVEPSGQVVELQRVRA